MEDSSLWKSLRNAIFTYPFNLRRRRLPRCRDLIGRELHQTEPLTEPPIGYRRGAAIRSGDLHRPAETLFRHSQ